MVPVLKIDVSAETSDKVANFGLRVLEPFGLMSDIISNNLTAYKIKNLRSITQRTNELLKIQGCEPSEVSSKFLSKFIDEASVENDPVMQEMWANLLAGEVITSENTVYINILKDLTKEAAIILDEVYKKALKENYDPYEDFLKRTVQGGDLGYFSQGEDDAPSMLISAASLSDKGKKSSEAKNNFDTLTHLERLDLVENKTYVSEKDNNRYGYSLFVQITPLGFRFMKACTTLET